MEPVVIVSHIANSSLAGQEQRFAQSLVTVGREAGTDIAFDAEEDLVVSHHHAEFYLEDGKLHIRDLSSRNGTYVNQKRITDPVELHPEDTVHFGYDGPSAKARLEDAEHKTEEKRQTLLIRLLPQKLRPGGESMALPARGARSPAPVLEKQPAPASVQMPLPRPMVPPPASHGNEWLGRAILLLLALALGVGGAAAYSHFRPLLDKRSESAASSSSSSASSAESKAAAVACLGRLEPAGGLFEVGALAGQTLSTVLVEEGQLVRRDDPLARLSSYASLQAEHEAAQTALEEANAQLRTVKMYAAASVAEARAAVQQTGKPLDLEAEALEAQVEWLKVHLQVAADDRKQLEAYNQAEVAAQLTRQKMVEQGAQRELTAAEKRLAQFRESMPLRRAQAEAQLQTAIANQARLEQAVTVKTAAKNVDRAAAQLSQAILRAPRDGKILKILLREGASLSGRPVLLLGDTRHMDVVAEVFETDIRHVSKGQRASVSSPAIPDRLRGEVSEVLWTVERNSARDLNPTAPEDRRIVPVRIRLSDEDVAKNTALLERLVNLQVHVRIAGD